MAIMSAALLVVAAAAQAIAAEPAPDKSGYTLFDPTPRSAMRAFSTDRPDTTESPYTVDAGHVQIELSLADYARNSRTHTFDVLPVNLKLGLTNAVDIQFIFTPFEHSVTGNRTVASGFGDGTQVRLKINLWGDDGGRTAFAIMPFVKVPTGARGLSNGNVEGGLILPLAIDLGQKFLARHDGRI